jgi:hypothetical protein
MGFGMVPPGVGKASSKLVDKKGCGGKVGMQKGGKLPKSERKLGMKGTVQKMQGGGRPGPYEMLQDPSKYEELYGNLPSPEDAAMALQAARQAGMLEQLQQMQQVSEPSTQMYPAGSKGPEKPTASMMESTVSYNGVPLAGPLSEEQKRSKRIDDAMRRISLIESAKTLDPKGGGIHETAPQDIAQQQAIIQQQQEAQAAYEEAEAQKAYGEAIASQRQGPAQQDPAMARVAAIRGETGSIIGTPKPGTEGMESYSAGEAAVMARDQLRHEGLPIPTDIDQAAAEFEASTAAGVAGQVNPAMAPQAQTMTPEQVFSQYQTIPFEQWPQEIQQGFLQWAQGIWQETKDMDEVRRRLGTMGQGVANRAAQPIG